MKTRTYLLLMLVAIIVPVACLATFGLAMLLQSERESRIRGIEEMANSTSLQIDSEIARAEAANRIVANSREIRTDDIEGLYQLLSATRTSPLSWTMIADYSGSGVINTLVPYGTPLAKNTGKWAADIYDAQRTRVGGYFIGAKSKRGVVSVNVPVPKAVGRQYVVVQIFDPNYFNKVFQRHTLGPGWIIGVFDANGISIARNRAAAQFVGKPVRPALYEASRRQANGMVDNVTREGVRVYTVFVRSSLTNWTVAIGVPVDEIESAARLTTWYAAAALLAILGVAVSIAVFFARRIDRALKGATSAAQALAEGTVVSVAPSGLQEADGLSHVLHRTGLALAHESAARAALEDERERLLAMERSARLRAEAQDEAKDNFISMLSHELRNPLAALTNAVAAVRMPGMPAPNRDRAWDIVNRQLAHLTHMVGDLLDVRRVLSGKVTLRTARVNVGELVKFCCDAKMVANTKDHEWMVWVEDAYATGDTNRLTQVVDNLLANAIKYTPAGGSISVRTSCTDGMVVIDVSDTGVGIAPDVLPTIFDSLVQGPTTIDRSQGGLGLGLSIARGLVHMHGGSITADSDGPGEGSRFTVRLPQAAGDAPPA
ncbi:sensor histidine kinase [Pseudoduganella lutea]|uniref:histidine kinase n=1 Tax=Pseudoduganella lutea TaxID=321985 RepID=A0A4P6KYN2_9BURK|nr:sensor histidine kinase [Pseudoduganella lutea]QBE63885.1 sensor histidine kinase [Pseudoduganella lutea]